MPYNVTLSSPVIISPLFVFQIVSHLLFLDLQPSQREGLDRWQPQSCGVFFTFSLALQIYIHFTNCWLCKWIEIHPNNDGMVLTTICFAGSALLHRPRKVRTDSSPPFSNVFIASSARLLFFSRVLDLSFSRDQYSSVLTSSNANISDWLVFPLCWNATHIQLQECRHFV